MPYKNPKAQSAYQVAFYNRRRKTWFDANGPCKQCGSTQHLEADHINPETKIAHKVWFWEENKRMAELAKCQVLCRECHREKNEREGFKGQYVEA